MLPAGCTPSVDGLSEAPQAKPFEGERLMVLVVGDRGMADSVRRLAGEWQAQTGSVLEVEEIEADQPLVSENLTADVVLYPAWRLGSLAEEKLLVPLPRELIEGEQFAWPDIFAQLRQREGSWGRDTLGVPLGSARLVLYYRADLLAALDQRPPETWSEYLDLARLLNDRGQLGDRAPGADDLWSGSIEPLAPGDAALTLLARAAPYARHREHYSALLNMETMDPLIDGPPFVRALEEMVAASQFRAEAHRVLGPEQIRTAFWKGECGLALTWPSAAPGHNELRARAEGAEVGFAPLPGSTEVWEPLGKFWDVRDSGESPRVPLSAAYGRLGSVTRQSRLHQVGFQFLLLLSTDPWCNQVSTFSGQTTLFRQTQVAQAKIWVEREVSITAARAYGEVARQVFAEPLTLDALRLPGRERYLEALDEAVAQAMAGELTPRDALVRAATRWREITEGHQVAVQRRSYQRSLGLEN